MAGALNFDGPSPGVPMGVHRLQLAYLLRRAHRYALAHGHGGGRAAVGRQCSRYLRIPDAQLDAKPPPWWWHVAYNTASNL